MASEVAWTAVAYIASRAVDGSTGIRRLNRVGPGGTVVLQLTPEITMKLRFIVLATTLFACRAGTDKNEGNESASGDASQTNGDSGDAWYDYDEGGDDDDGWSDYDDDGDEDEEKEDDKEDGGADDEKEMDECGEDFDPDEPCEGTWETGAICYEGDTIWYCEDGAWSNK